MKPKSDKGFFALMMGILVLTFALFFVGKMFEGSSSTKPFSFSFSSPNVDQNQDRSDWKIIEDPTTGLTAECMPSAEYDMEQSRIYCSNRDDAAHIVIQTGEHVSSTEFLSAARTGAESIGAIGSDINMGRQWSNLITSSSFKTKNGYDASVFQFKQVIFEEGGKKTEGTSPFVYVVRTPTHDSPSRMTFVYYETPWNMTESIPSEDETLRSIVDSIQAVKPK